MLKPGQASLQLATMAVFGGHMNLAGQLAMRAEVPVSKKVAPTLVASVQRRHDGKVVFRDLIATAGIRVLDNGKQTVILHPGLRIPTGGIAEGLVFSPLSTASVDPWLGADFIVGTDWLLVASVQGQVSLYPGWDDRRQGAFGRTDLLVARRVGGAGILRSGVSAIGQLNDDRGQGKFHEVALVGGGSVELHQRWSVGASLRVPVWQVPHAYDVGVGINVNYVVGKPKKPRNDAHQHPASGESP